ncbi:transcription-repair coupling factor [Candidatus Formimonas warabiya]|uniref:Transcription-repair-coupling factor n=1 Tax=Formimonas warabiya TaxID=1761012 RepID=A0A3G1KWW6_FORW1|nr:transcription-repair coupling factor [Candidatus Formimonas warabiya]ATW26988.1 transcription-repair coupling factor [Candidatus Formimonas warabiya]
MICSQLVWPWKEIRQYRQLKENLRPGAGHLVVGLTDLPRSCWTVALEEDVHVPILVITSSAEAAKKTYADLVSLAPQKQVFFFPHVELLPYEVYARNLEIGAQRITALHKMAGQEPVVVVTSVEALIRRTVSRETFNAHTLTLATGSRIDILQLSVLFINMGYSKENLVEIPGTFSIRGGIIDVYPFTENHPVRVELFDDEIESIRFFDPDTQRSLEEIGQVILPPARELPANSELLISAGRRLEQELTRVLPSYSGAAKRNLREKFSFYVEQMSQGIWMDGMEQFLLYFYPKAGSVLNYLPPTGLVIVHEPDSVRQTVEKMRKQMDSWYYDLLEEGKILPSFGQNFLDFAELKEVITGYPFVLLAQLPETAGLPVQDKHDLISRELPSYKGQMHLLAEDLKYYQQQKYHILFSASSSVRKEKLKELSQELGMEGIEIIDAALSRGFESPVTKMLVLSETDILGQTTHAKARRPLRKGEKIATFLDLKVGDYVVHVNHGIGRYLGVVRLDIGDAQRDYFDIRYAGEDKLYVPTDQVDLIQKYVGADGQTPKVYKLGGTEWNRVKTKVRNSVQDMAKELLALYAAREAVKGHGFSTDTVWQKEFEDAFPYPETPDQLRAVEEIKKDMENSKPMERLLCGDVGYGKTEVALRAAFKAVMDGKQVAVLVPTTVLAQQHQRTFEERFSGMPVTIGVLSRFKSAKETAQTLKDLAQGMVDIVIGTHRLISKDVRFKDLGLLIIDEEQRFGVGHKEKIKNMKQNIDVLTLTATPIPRTLHMSLVGVRDMSVIETPPEDRQPVQTYVMEYQDRVIKEAISREIGRGGQVYFVHNRINNIYRSASQIQELVPEAKIVVGHGQMKEHELETVMLDFVEGKYNVLVCTTIVESGLDIPNVNTLIVDEADHLGLSQLYQLRGRVGRSNRQAFAYFTYRKDKILSGIAKKRLTAIRDFTELGSGFKIAMRDMEIRGAGNILGPEQHGHILAVGFDLYCRLVEEEVNKQRQGQTQALEKITPSLELNMDAYIPDNYVLESDLKIELYKRLAAAEELKDVDDLEYEVEDRFGVMPEVVRNLFVLGKLKVLAQKLRINGIFQQKQLITIRFAPDHAVVGNHLAEIAQEFGRRISFSVSGDLEIRVNAGGCLPPRVLQILLSILTKLLGFIPKAGVV